MISQFRSLTVFVSVAALTMGGCAATTTPEQKLQLEEAVEARDPAPLQGKMRVLYDKRVNEILVEEAIAAGDPSELKGRQKIKYLRQIKANEQQAQRKLARQQELKDQEIAKQQELEEQRRIAAAENARLLEEQKELAAQQRAEEIELAKQRKVAAGKAFQRKIKQPLHENWITDMRDLTTHFRDNGFEPATRLVDIYARTMQFLLHAEPDEKQFSAFYQNFSDTEKLDHRRMFHNRTGTELIAQFWDNRSSQPIQ